MLDPDAHPIQRIHTAYLKMSPFYRPGAPGDGMGSIDLTKDQVADGGRLHREARRYAAEFIKEEDTRTFNIGCADYRTLQAFFWLIEAARLLASGRDGNEGALKLVKFAEAQIKAEIKSAGGANRRNG